MQVSNPVTYKTIEGKRIVEHGHRGSDAFIHVHIKDPSKWGAENKENYHRLFDIVREDIPDKDYRVDYKPPYQKHGVVLNMVTIIVRNMVGKPFWENILEKVAINLAKADLP